MLELRRIIKAQYSYRKLSVGTVERKDTCPKTAVAKIGIKITKDAVADDDVVRVVEVIEPLKIIIIIIILVHKISGKPTLDFNPLTLMNLK